ncbi:NACHT domain-containing protein [Cellulomonas phragmiteti]|uniref:NACHT domain-containing protein n=1 Tax=Cellulomonas phragmiteti TaxID=478780 RepID=UPI00363AF41C
MDKAEKDAKKLSRLTERLAREHPTKAVRGFFITAEEPGADQRDAVRRHGGPFVTPLSIRALRKELFDAAAYIAARSDYAFGSARDPRTNSSNVSTKYIGLDLLERPLLTEAWAIQRISDALSDGHTLALTGDYGIGKSMSLREAWLTLGTKWQKDSTSRIPIHLNLRDHQGQDDPSEALHRHAKRIGFANSADLVRAWRSDQTVLILDGFDEITFPVGLEMRRASRMYDGETLPSFASFAKRVP